MNVSAALSALERIQALCAEAEAIYAELLGPRVDAEELPWRDDLDELARQDSAAFDAGEPDPLNIFRGLAMPASPLSNDEE